MRKCAAGRFPVLMGAKGRSTARVWLETLEDRTLPSLVAAFGFNEGAGATASDVSGLGNHGTITAATWSATGQFGSALSFNGTNSLVTVADAASLDLTTGMTLEAWVNPTTINGWETVILKETTGELAYALYADNAAARPGAWVRQGSVSYATLGTSQLPVNVWSHLATTYDGSVLRLFVNGTQVSSLNQSGSMIVTSGALRIGGNNVWSEWFNGLIDEVRIYNHALTPAEIQADMTTPLADTTPPTITTTAPVAGATGVASSANITVTFNEAMATATINASTVELRDSSGALIAGAISYDSATRTATFDPAANLTPDAAYTVLVRGGATDPRVQDVAGNALASDASWSFTVAPLSLSIGDAAVTEGNSGAVNASFTINLSAASSQTVTVIYSTANNTATAGSDYTGAAPTVVTFDPGQISQTVVVAVQGDTISEGNETFFVNLSNPTNAVLADAQGIGTIVDDDAALIGSEGFGYFAYTHPFESVNLVPGAAGVFTIRSTGNDNTNLVTLTSGNTFNFYGTAYTSFYVSTNGLITFGGSNNSATNTDLTAAPTQRAIAPMWDDWVNVSGQTMLIGKYEDTGGASAPDRLIIEWNSVQGNTSSPSPVTFQAILQLNTGALPGEFTYNYPDLDAGNTRSNGGSATVGIKDSGTQGSRRLVVSFNSATNANVASGKAIKFRPDTTAPNVTLTAPASGATVAGTVAVTAAASDNVDVAGVQFLLDGANFGAEDTTAPYAASWDTTTVANGAHTLTARARDAVGNTISSSAISVTVNNFVDATAPTVSITSPVEGATTTGTVSVAADAADDVGVAGVQFLLDGADLGIEDTTAPYAVAWNSTTAADGAHALTARARDAAGNVTTSLVVNVVVSNPDITAPTVSLTAPANGATVAGAVTVSANAGDNIGVVGVQFLLDGANLGPEDTSSPYSMSWSTTTVSDGAHTLTAQARDAAGNVTTSAVVNVTVANLDVVPPTVAMTAPANGATVSGTVTVSANAADNFGVAGVQFLLDGNNLGAEDTSAPYSISWTTTSIANGSHTLTARARDAAGNATVSAAFSVSVANGGVALTIDGAQMFQTMDGFGVNVNAHSWNNGELTPALDMLVDEMGATLYRVVYDMGDWEAVNDNADPNTADGTYFNALYSNSSFQELWGTLGYLNQKGINTGITLSIMGRVPAWMGGSVINASMEDEWVETITTLVAYARNTAQIQFNSLDPINEPDWDGMEGPQVDQWQYTRLLHKLATRLDALGFSDLRFVGPNTASIDAGVNVYMPEMMANPVVMSKVDHFGLHNYAGYAAGADNAIKNSAYPTKEFWITEVTNPWDIMTHIANNPSGIMVWDAFDSAYIHPTLHGATMDAPNDSGNGPAPIAYDASTGVYTPRKSFYEDEQIFKFVAPGSVRIGAAESNGNLTMYAFYNALSGRITIVGRNAGTSNITVAGVLRNVPATTAFEFYKTDIGSNFERLGDLFVTNGAFSFSAPGNSFFTLTALTAPDTTAPVVTVNAPAAGAIVAGTVSVTAVASDNVGVAGVQFLLDGADLGVEDTTNPYAVSWNTASVANGNHTLTARARDAAGNSTMSAAVSITVNNDAVPPTVALTAPADGAVLFGTTTVAADAGDNLGVAGVQFMLDNVPLGAEDTSAPYQMSWDTTAASNGTHVVTAVARDLAGNTTVSSAVNVTVANPDTAAPAVSLTSPTNGAAVAGAVSLAADASDNVGVVGVQFLLDGIALGAEDFNAPYTISWDSTAAADGAHALSARARDAAGNATVSSVVNVTVNNAPDVEAPVVALTAPANGANVSGTIVVSANASDNIGVAGVQFLLNGANLGAEDAAAPFSISWNTTAAANGVYTLSARARDAAGNSALSATISVTVANAAPTGLVLALDFNEGNGTTAADVSGFGNNGTISGAAWNAGGMFGGALSFNGVNNLVTVADAASLDLTTGMTLEAWVKPTTINGWETVILKETSGELAYAIYADNNGNDSGGPRRPGAWIRQGSTSYAALGTAQLTINAWTHLASTYDGATLRFYVNGLQVSSLARTGAINTTTNPLRIGGNNVWSEWFNGLIDEVRIYNRALSPAEIQSDMNTPVGSPLQLAGAAGPGVGAAPLTLAQIAPVFDEAVARWQTLALEPAQTQRLRDVTVQIMDLPRNLLGLASNTIVWLDVNAAGQGWFVDSTPGDDGEFRPGGLRNSDRGRVDLLTVLSHELGHILGLDDDDAADPAASSGVMGRALPAGVRRVQLTEAAAELSSPTFAARTSVETLDALWAFYAAQEESLLRKRALLERRTIEIG